MSAFACTVALALVFLGMFSVHKVECDATRDQIRRMKRRL